MKVETAWEVVDYFSTTVGYLPGEGKKKASTQEGEHESKLSPVFFRLRQGLEPYDIPEDGTDFLLDVHKAHIKKNNQE